MFENKFYNYRPEVCPEIGKIIDVMVLAQGFVYGELTILTLVYTFFKLVVHNWMRPAIQTEDPDPYPLSNGGQY